MSEPIWIVKEAKIDKAFPDAVENIVGQIIFADSEDGKMAEKLIRSGNVRLCPFGFGESGKDGEVDNFNLLTMSLAPELK